MSKRIVTASALLPGDRAHPIGEPHTLTVDSVTWVERRSAYGIQFAEEETLAYYRATATFEVRR